MKPTWLFSLTNKMVVLIVTRLIQHCCSNFDAEPEISGQTGELTAQLDR